MADYVAKQIGDMETFYQGLFRKGRAEVGIDWVGLAFVELEPNADNHPDHDHQSAGQEEVYIVLRGTGEMVVDGETVPLTEETVVKVGAAAKRKINPGPDGMRLVALGGTPGKAYEAPGYTEVGAPDPLG